MRETTQGHTVAISGGLVLFTSGLLICVSAAIASAQHPNWIWTGVCLSVIGVIVLAGGLAHLFSPVFRQGFDRLLDAVSYPPTDTRVRDHGEDARRAQELTRRENVLRRLREFRAEGGSLNDHVLRERLLRVSRGRPIDDEQDVAVAGTWASSVVEYLRVFVPVEAEFFAECGDADAFDRLRCCLERLDGIIGRWSVHLRD